MLHSLDEITKLAGAMNDVVRDGTVDPGVFEPAFEVIRPLPEKKYGMEIRELHRFASSLKRPRAGVGGDKLAACRDVIKKGAADAASLSCALGAMLLACGHGPVQFVVAQTQGMDGFGHAYVRVRHNGKWIALDPWSGRQAGWEPTASKAEFFEHDREGPPIRK
jgi:hypothetical protein